MLSIFLLTSKICLRFPGCMSCSRFTSCRLHLKLVTGPHLPPCSPLRPEKRTTKKVNVYFPAFTRCGNIKPESRNRRKHCAKRNQAGSVESTARRPKPEEVHTSERPTATKNIVWFMFFCAIISDRHGHDSAIKSSVLQTGWPYRTTVENYCPAEVSFGLALFQRRNLCGPIRTLMGFWPKAAVILNLNGSFHCYFVLL